ncbi:hypothetical protein MPH_03414 [Macrophomina phaseolina MS6]|uniref:Uncharacterized protein n=1 Tax=Macrophomina phaseolina (strain MS6) TaxID=1126212 RepID=K2SSB1_MACPH|nr:hypothetical protein MPH_03414 [Macrophomina phaseolina MS6]
MEPIGYGPRDNRVETFVQMDNLSKEALQRSMSASVLAWFDLFKDAPTDRFVGFFNSHSPSELKLLPQLESLSQRSKPLLQYEIAT